MTVSLFQMQFYVLFNMCLYHSVTPSIITLCYKCLFMDCVLPFVTSSKRSDCSPSSLLSREELSFIGLFIMLEPISFISLCQAAIKNICTKWQSNWRIQDYYFFIILFCHLILGLHLLNKKIQSGHKYSNVVQNEYRYLIGLSVNPRFIY